MEFIEIHESKTNFFKFQFGTGKVLKSLRLKISIKLINIENAHNIDKIHLINTLIKSVYIYIYQYINAISDMFIDFEEKLKLF